jgi:hypothetical protein
MGARMDKEGGNNAGGERDRERQRCGNTRGSMSRMGATHRLFAFVPFRPPPPLNLGATRPPLPTSPLASPTRQGTTQAPTWMP